MGVTQAIPPAVGKVLPMLRNPSLTRTHRIAWWVTMVFFVIAVFRLGNWGDLLRHAGLHLWVAGWLLVVTYRTRTIGVREVVRMWMVGFFTVVLFVFVFTEPVERLIGTGNLQTAFWVPIVEEAGKVLALVWWGLRQRRRGSHATMSDFVLLGFAVGAGFAFHEDALWERVAASGFGPGLARWFPTFLTSPYVVTHSGWGLLIGFGVGVFLLHRTRVWGLPIGAAFVALAVLDHSAINLRGGFDWVRSLVNGGRLAASMIVVAVVVALAHDWFLLWWTGSRDNWFPEPKLVDDLRGLTTGTWDERLATFIARGRYRRLRTAAFADLFRVRFAGDPAGDRRHVHERLNSTAVWALNRGGSAP